MDSGDVVAPNNQITRMCLRERRDLALKLLGERMPSSDNRQPDSIEVAARDMAVWMIFQPMAEGGGCPTFGMMSKLMGLTKHGVFYIRRRLRMWDDEKHAEKAIRERIMHPNYPPLSDREITEFYAEIRKPGTWPWNRGGRHEHGRMVRIENN